MEQLIYCYHCNSYFFYSSIFFARREL